MTIDIISIAQQASPKVAGQSAFERAQLSAFSSVVVSTRSSTYCVEVGARRGHAAQQVARAELPGREVRRSGDLLPLYFHSSAPRRHTNTNATASSATKISVSTSTKAPAAFRCTATG